MKSNHRWAAAGLLAASQILGKCKKNAFEVAQIYGATACLRGAQLARDFSILQASIFACVMVLILGVIFIEAAILFYIPVENSTKAGLVFVLGGVHLLGGGILLAYFTSSKQWLRQALKYNEWIKSSVEKNNF